MIDAVRMMKDQATRHLAVTQDGVWVTVAGARANIAAVQSDLRNLSVAQEAYHTEHITYTATLSSPDFDSINPWNRAYKYMLEPGRSRDFWHHPRYAEMLAVNQSAEVKACRQPAGVEIWEWQGKRPTDARQTQGLFHAKYAVVDRTIALVGSYNLDPRSRDLNKEIGVVADSPELAGCGSSVGSGEESVACFQEFGAIQRIHP